MDESAWLTCPDSRPMLAYLNGKVGTRKYHLTRCSFLRRFWDLLTDERLRRAVEVAERFADGAASLHALRRARGAARRAFDETLATEMERGALFGSFGHGPLGVVWCVAGLDQEDSIAPWLSSEEKAAWREAHACNMAGLEWIALGAIPMYYADTAPPPDNPWKPVPPTCLFDLPGSVREANSAAQAKERAAQADLLRDLFGNPFRPLLPFNSQWLAWNQGTVKHLARTVYEERLFDHLPVLADALEEAGCTHSDILNPADCRASM